ncbi:putative gamma-glutamylcyclotransferase YkqA [Lentibacillus kapialis]|uniref:Gamma-glutamylcyclotransferase YkqA n=1 Tax=Lentibacillus kapialis TaxID=340214 RepID=A0A917PN96_9BACI|nr:gamma-glutamylcyclotransferase family protein [Lentibacillus kapialis]GGJ85073.1 putative gamma-glutamylcyclotransferase YkqA [Lentibacillus kapialis]
MSYVFVYGTLRRSGKNHDLLGDLQCVFRQCCVIGALYDSGKGYPVMKQGRSHKIYGELYDVSKSQLAAIDGLEGFKKNHSDNLFERKILRVYTDTGNDYDAFAYVAGPSFHPMSERMASGDWLVYRYLKQKNLLYFAYGSCMDDERFKQAGVDHYFKDDIGKGVLEGFAFQFSRNTSDGGKADLVENTKETVEGKVYNIPWKATHYLYEREGVFASSYRPAIVPVSINGSIHQALTFIGVRKSPETAPTKRYGTEIMRGGKGYLSDGYLQKLRKKMQLLNG